MNKSIRILAMLGLAAGMAYAGTARADESSSADSSTSSTDQIEELRSTLGDLTAQINALKSKAPDVQVHGFAETDAFNDTDGGFQEVVGNGKVLLPLNGGGNYLNDNGMTQVSVRNSRFDFLATKEINGWKTKGYLELDLLGYDPSPLYGNAAPVNNTYPTAVYYDKNTGLLYNTLALATAADGGSAANIIPLAGSTVTSAKTNTAASASEAGFYTNATVRVRHAYLDATKDGWEIMAGQYWTLLGWNMDYTLATVSVAPVMGVIYQRTPQIRVGYTLMDGMPIKLQMAVDAERPTSRESDMFNYSQGARLVMDGWTSQFCGATGASKPAPLSLGISGTEREFKWDGNIATASDANFAYDTWGKAIAADALIPIIPFDGKDSCSLVVTGEWSAGAGYGDEFPSWSGGASALTEASGNPDLDSGVGMLDSRNGVSPIGTAGANVGNFTLVELQSKNAQIQFHLPPSIGTFFTFGYGQIASPNVSDLQYAYNGVANAAAGKFGSIYNLDSATFANVMQDFGPNIRAALEFDSFYTHYTGVTTASAFDPGQGARDNRIQLSTWYRF
jgi:hypothetical protein